MADYIKREDALSVAHKIGKKEYDWGNVSNAAIVMVVEGYLRAVPAADVRPVVLCRDCVYWQKPQVWQNDGTFRDYEPGEYENGSFFGGVSLEIGVNFGSFCALYDREHRNELPQFMNENDFCSKGYKREES